MFATFEGIEGSGKSTALNMLAGYYRDVGESPLLTREPGGSNLGRRLRSMLLDARSECICGRAELYLFLADRAQHVESVIRPALEAGQTVLCDRYSDSTLAYQGYGRGGDLEKLEFANRLATGGLRPDITFLLDLPVSQGLARAGARNKNAGTIISEGRFDSESRDFHERVRKGYLALAAREPERIVLIDASGSPDAVFRACLAALERLEG